MHTHQNEPDHSSEEEQEPDHSSEEEQEQESDTETNVGVERKKRKRTSTDGQEGAAGLADVMSKILASTKPKKKASKAIILSRAKKDGQTNVDKDNVQQTGEKVTKSTRDKNSDLKLENLNRSKPDPAHDFHLERQLAKIATRGVVRLFNAVTVQQKTSNIKKEGKSNSGRRKIITKEEDVQNFDNLISQSSNE